MDMFGEIMEVKIKECSREFKGWSLYKLAQMMEIPQQTVYSWASGRTQPSYENWDRICAVLGCGMGDLLNAQDVQQKLNFSKNL